MAGQENDIEKNDKVRQDVENRRTGDLLSHQSPGFQTNCNNIYKAESSRIKENSSMAN